MNWDQLFSSQSIMALWVPALIGVAIIVILYFLRRLLYSFIHKLTAKTATLFDDILVRETRIATLLWCIWLGIWAGYKIAETPAAWVVVEDQVIPVLFVAFGIYTVVMIIVATFKWYKVEICPRSHSSLDDIMMSVLMVCTPIVGGALGVILILNMLNISSPAINGWMSDHLAKVGFLVILMVILLLTTVFTVPKFVESTLNNTNAEQTKEELKKRSDTLVNIIETTIQIVIIFIFLLMILSEFTINIVAFLTGASVLGVAVGFGAQWLVKDVIAGLFIIMENQFHKGDVIKIAGESGVVEEINLRRTILRDLDGVYHVVPNGEIRVASNYTKRFARVNITISVAYETDLDKAIAVIDRVGREMAADLKWASLITSPPKAVRVDNLGESGIDFRVVGDTKPSAQWDVTGELKLRLKKAFDKEGIEIPYQHTKVIFGNMPPQLTPQGNPLNHEVKTEKKTGETLNN
jgi:moderate conductance mechanosensitive channel